MSNLRNQQETINWSAKNVLYQKKEFNSTYSLYTLLQNLSLYLFEKIQLNQVFTKNDDTMKQLNLFD